MRHTGELGGSGTKSGKSRKGHRWRITFSITAIFLVMCGGAAIYFSQSAITVRNELEEAKALVPQLRNAIQQDDPVAVNQVVSVMRGRTTAAREASSNALWTAAGSLPWIGPNFRAVTEVAISADDMTTLGAQPLAEVFKSLDWKSLASVDGAANLPELEKAVPKIRAAAYAVESSTARLESIDAGSLLPALSTPLTEIVDQLRDASAGLSTAADASEIIARMMGGSAPHSYLLIIQNNAEVRASGGIPGALAVLQVDSGRITLGAQASSGDFGAMTPPLAVDQAQRDIYSGRLGKFVQDVNLTPDFPTAATNAVAMWDRRYNQRLEGAISIDPVALSYLLDATGPIDISIPELGSATGGLPTTLSGENVVRTLLSDVYSEIEQPQLQDAYFAAVAHKIFTALSAPSTDTTKLLAGLSRASEERRVLLWSGNPLEQEIIAKYPLSGSVEGPSVQPAQFGVYFNDGTGAKMDYYLERTVQLIKECPRNGYEQTTVRITSTNMAPADAATSLPAYVTGDGVFGVRPGTVQTNIMAYGPAQANVETARLDGQQTGFAPYLHSNRPVGVIAVHLAPGEQKTVELTFGKIVQHTEPNLVVTPTVQSVKDVNLPTQNAACG